MNAIYQINNWKAIILGYQIGYKNGLKNGERLTPKEWKEVARRHPDWLTYCGASELNLKELAKEYASHDKKVLMIKERKNDE